MKRYLIIFSFVDRAEDKAKAHYFILEATTLAAAWTEAERRSIDARWLVETFLGGDFSEVESDPIFDTGVDAISVLALAELAMEAPDAREPAPVLPAVTAPACG